MFCSPKAFFAFFLILTSCANEQRPIIGIANPPKQVSLFAAATISTDLYERDMAISPEGNEIIYTLGNHKQTVRSLVQIKRKGSAWGEKQILSFSGKYQDIEPFISVDGNKLYFASNRPIQGDSSRSDYNIWISEKKNGNWQDPIPLDTLINTLQDEFYPSASANGNLYFTATRENGIGLEDIFVSYMEKGGYQTPVVLDSAINTSVYEFNAYVGPDEDLLIFSSYGRDDDFGGGDLYYSKKDENGKWSRAQNMGNIVNSDKLDYCPFIDFPRNTFYFTSERLSISNKRIRTVSELKNEATQVLNGFGNIYYVDLKSLELK